MRKPRGEGTPGSACLHEQVFLNSVSRSFSDRKFARFPLRELIDLVTETYLCDPRPAVAEMNLEPITPDHEIKDMIAVAYGEGEALHALRNAGIEPEDVVAQFDAGITALHQIHGPRHGAKVNHRDKLSYAETFEQALQGLLQDAEQRPLSLPSQEFAVEQVPLKKLIPQANEAFENYLRLQAKKQFAAAANELARLQDILQRLAGAYGS